VSVSSIFLYDTATGCGGSLAASSQESVLTSPGYPNNYTNSLNCDWTITAAVGHRVWVRVTDVDVEGFLGILTRTRIYPALLEIVSFKPHSTCVSFVVSVT